MIGWYEERQSGGVCGGYGSGCMVVMVVVV